MQRSRSDKKKIVKEKKKDNKENKIAIKQIESEKKY